eukprot:9494909-Pyramimonas_sp.AAC.1
MHRTEKRAVRRQGALRCGKEHGQHVHRNQGMNFGHVRSAALSMRVSSCSQLLAYRGDVGVICEVGRVSGVGGDGSKHGEVDA